MFKAYSDESGHSGDSRYVCMGGCVATVEAWARFEADWRKALDDEGLEEFHMTEFESGSGDFVKYKNNPLAHKAFLARLMAIMEEHVAIYVASTEIVYRDALRKPINADSPFYSCLYGILDSVTSYAGTLDLSERVEMVFADNKEYGRRVRCIYQEVKEKMPHAGFRLTSDEYGKPRDIIPLQAADIVAYEVRKESERGTFHIYERSRWPYTQLRKKPFYWNGGFLPPENMTG